MKRTKGGRGGEVVRRLKKGNLEIRGRRRTKRRRRDDHDGSSRRDMREGWIGKA